jgi:hypothetical protein
MATIGLFFLDLQLEKLYNIVNSKITQKEAKMKTLILIFSCLLLVIPSQAAEEHQQNQQQLKDPNQRLEEIEKYIACRHREMENYYADQLIELKQRAEAEIRLLEVADKPVYASLAAQAEVAKMVLHIDNYGYRALWYLIAETERMLQLKDEHESYGGFEDSIKKSPKRFAVTQSRIAERKSEILAKLEQETAELERQKNYALTVALPELEKRLKQDLLKPEPEPTHGLVTGIVYSADKSSAIVDRQIVHEGDVIHGATVVKIYKDKVKFSKSGKSWEQKVQQTPEVYWK